MVSGNKWTLFDRHIDGEQAYHTPPNEFGFINIGEKVIDGDSIKTHGSPSKLIELATIQRAKKKSMGRKKNKQSKQSRKNNRK